MYSRHRSVAKCAQVVTRRKQAFYAVVAGWLAVVAGAYLGRYMYASDTACLLLSHDRAVLITKVSNCPHTAPA